MSEEKMTPDERRARAEQVLGEIDTIPHPEEPHE